MVKVSVIVPVYNVEPYIEKCLDSLVNQTLSDIEVIVVNDGSKDNSQTIIDSFCERYSFVKGYQKPNGGLSDARNFGIPLATGEYIGFVDSDDYIDLNMYELLYQKAVKTGAEVVECNLHHTFDTYEDTEVGRKIADSKEMLMNGRSVVWNKIYHRDWLLQTGVTFHKGKIYEDVEFFSKLVPYIHKIAYIDEACVHYVQRGASLNNQQTLKTLDILDVLQEIKEYYLLKGFYEEYKGALEYLFARIILCSSFSRICGIENRKDRKWALKKSWDYLNQSFPEWRQNRYIKEDRTKKIIFSRSFNCVTFQVYGVILPFYFKNKRRHVKK